MVVFLSGSRSIQKLTAEMKADLARQIIHNQDIIVGDAEGVDTLVQDFFRSMNYDKVTVYHIGSHARNNLGFKGKQISGNKYVDKDIAMCTDCDYGLMFWDCHSNGTMQNRRRLQSLNKPNRMDCTESME